MTNSDLLEYKNYYGSIHFDSRRAVFYGKIEFIRDLVSFEATEAKGLIRAFEEAVDEYLEDCDALQRLPDKPFKGSFNIRLTPHMHRELGILSLQHKISVNSLVKSAIKEFIDHQR